MSFWVPISTDLVPRLESRRVLRTRANVQHSVWSQTTIQEVLGPRVPSSAQVCVLFLRYAACLMASGHRWTGTDVPNIIAHASSANILFIRSATPFCSGEWGAVYSSFIPIFSHHCFSAVPIYSPLLSARNCFGFMSYWRSR